MSTPEARVRASQGAGPIDDLGSSVAIRASAGDADGESGTVALADSARMGPDRRSPSGEPWDLPEYEAIVRDLADKLRRVGALNDVLQTAVDEIEGARAALRQERGQLDRVVGELDAASAETRRAAAHLGRLDPGGLRERVDRVEPALTTLLQERLAEVERTVTTGLAGLAPLLAAAHDEATRAAEAAVAAGSQAAEAAAATGQRTADAAAESGRRTVEAATQAGRLAVDAATAAGQHAAGAAGEAGRQTALRVEAAEATLGERLDLATGRLATDLGDLLTDRFAAVGQTLSAQEERAQQGLVALQQGVAEQALIGRQATERGLASLHEQAAAGATSALVGEGFAAVQGRLEEIPGRFDGLGQRMDATAAVADRAALTAQAAEQAARGIGPAVSSELGALPPRTAALLGGRLVALLVIQVLTLALVAGLAYLVWQGR
jgi:hypothetical protein